MTTSRRTFLTAVGATPIGSSMATGTGAENANGRIRSILTIAIPSEFPDINAALDFLDDKSIDRGATVTIKVSPGTFTYTNEVEISHPQGDRIEIVGSGSAETVIRFKGCAGFILRSNKIRRINAMTIDGYDKWGRKYDALADKQGIELLQGACATVGPDVVVQQFTRCGLLAYQGSILRADGVISRHNGSDGFVASANSYVDCSGAQAYGNEGNGFYCDWKSQMDARGSISRDNPGDLSSGARRGGQGYTSVFGGYIDARGSRAGGNPSVGYYCSTGSEIYAPSSRAEGNGGGGYLALHRSLIRAENASSEQNKGTGFQADVQSTISASQAIVKNNAGYGFRADNNSTIVADKSQCSGNAVGGWLISGGSQGHAVSARSSGPGHGFYVDIGATMVATLAVADAHRENGFVVAVGSTLSAVGAFSTNNGAYGFLGLGNSTIDAKGATVSGNRLGTCSPEPRNTSERASSHLFL